MLRAHIFCCFNLRYVMCRMNGSSDFVKSALLRLLCPRVCPLPPPLASHVGGTETRGEEARGGGEEWRQRRRN